MEIQEQPRDFFAEFASGYYRDFAVAICGGDRDQAKQQVLDSGSFDDFVKKRRPEVNIHADDEFPQGWRHSRGWKIVLDGSHLDIMHGIGGASARYTVFDSGIESVLVVHMNQTALDMFRRMHQRIGDALSEQS